MSKKTPPPSEPTAAAEGPLPRLTPFEEEVSLICLRYFRGEWDIYLDYLSGGRVTEKQRLREQPVVERLRDLDLRTDYLTNFLEEEVVAGLPSLEFDGLLRLWELGLMVNPELDPFGARAEENAAAEKNGGAEPPPSLH